MAKVKIFIDAGHNNSGYNTGATGNGLREQDITFSVAQKLGVILKNDFEIKLSRPTQSTNLGTDNVSAVNERWKLANSWGANYFISIHCNAGGGSGAETYYYRNDSKDYATAIHEVYVAEMSLTNRGVIKRDNLAVLNKTSMPSILIELAFIDAPLTKPDVDILKNKQQEMAEALAKGFYKYLNVVQGNKDNEEVIEVRYNTIDEIPAWGKEAIQKLIDKGYLQGNTQTLNLSEDMIRVFVINYRAGLYN